MTGIRRKRLLITCLIKAVVTALVFALVFEASRWLDAYPDRNPSIETVAAATVYFSSLLLAAVWVFFLCSFWLRKAVINAICFALLFVWGSVSYYMCPVDTSADNGAKGRAYTVRECQFEAPNRTMAAFFPSRGGFENLGERARCHYFAFHFLVVFFVAAVMFSIFGRGLVNRLRRVLVPHGYLNVLWGDTDAGFLLAKDIMHSTYKLQTVMMLPEDLRFDEDDFKRITHHLDDEDIIWQCYDHVGRLYLRGRNHYFLSDSGHDNVVCANRLVEKLKRLGRFEPDRRFFYIRIEADYDERMFFDWAESIKDVVTPIIVSEAEMVARNFLVDHPMLECPGVSVDASTARVSGDFRILQIGLGATGGAVLREMVCGGQFTGAGSFRVDVIECDPAIRENFKTRYSEAIEAYGITFLSDGRGQPLEAEGEGFDRFMQENLRTYNRIVICLPGDDTCIRVAMSIVNLADDRGVGPDAGVLFTRVSDPDRYGYAAASRKLAFFGDVSEVYKFARLDADPVDSMAMILNAEWEKDKSTKGIVKAWHNAPFRNQQSSRASAMGARWHAQAMGLDIVSADDPRPAVTAGEFDAILSPVRETLAINEHLRWNAYHRMLGYARWDMDSPRIEDLPKERRKANQIVELGRHAALVSFDELSAVDYRIACAVDPANGTRLKPSDFIGDVEVDVKGYDKRKTSLQAYDIRFVNKIFENVRAAGMKLVRRTPPADPA